MASSWTPEQLTLIARARELEIAIRRPDSSLRQWLPIWVVCVDDQVYVRTWYRRTTGWFGQVTVTRQARVRVPGVEVDVVVADIGGTDLDVRAAVDRAYHAKYGTPGDATVAGMTAAAAAATTLRLAPAAGETTTEHQQR